MRRPRIPEIAPAARSLALLYGAALAVIGHRYFAALGPEPLPYALFFMVTWVAWCLSLGAMTTLPLWLRPRSRVALGVTVVVAALIDTVFYAGSASYARFAVHGGELFIRLAVAGSHDPAIRRWAPAALAAAFGVFVVLNLALAFLARTLARRGWAPPHPGRRSGLAALAVALVLLTFPSLAAFRGWHWVQGQSDAFPFLPQISANRVFAKLFRQPRADENRRGRDWPAYPLTTYASAPTAVGTRRPNVLLILLESWRADAVTPALMPRLSRWATQFTRAEHHYSGGDATRYGLFSLFYGLNATPIERLRAEKTGPRLFSYLTAADYDIDLLTGEPLAILGSDETVFVDVLDRIRFPKIRRTSFCDWIIADQARWSLRTDPPGRPYFRMAFFASTHARYDFIPEALGMTRKTAKQLKPRARYDASLDFVDRFIDDVLTAAAARPDWDDTLVVITGDHGEAFGEHGHNMHGWTMNEEESSVPLLIRFPGQTTGSVLTHVTTHVDVVPTILHAMGDPASPASYSDGRVITDASPRLIFQQDWRRMGIFDGDTRIDFFSGSSGYLLPMRAFGDHEEPRDKQSFIVRHRDAIERLLRDNARFIAH